MTLTLRPMLMLYSHGRTPPLQPPPDLKYDLRSIPNPPKAVRDVSDGRSKRLREHMLSEPKFTARLDAVEEAIRQAMEEKIKIANKEEEKKGSTFAEDSAGLVEDGKTRESKDAEAAIAQDESNRGDHREAEGPILRVGCNCALGHHRSVAFVSELAQRNWPRDWDVDVVHRDLENRRASGTRKRQKQAWSKQRKEKDHGFVDGTKD